MWKSEIHPMLKSKYEVTQFAFGIPREVFYGGSRFRMPNDFFHSPNVPFSVHPIKPYSFSFSDLI